MQVPNRSVYTTDTQTFHASNVMPDSDEATPSPTVCQAMWERLGQQSWPKPALYVVATPIGNLTDMSLRAWYGLRAADIIAAEDTRSSRPLLQAWGIETPLLAAHRHNEREATAQIIERLSTGARVALISDAGAPAISDPGGRLVHDVREAGYPVIPLPGPNAAITALMAVGATTDEQPAFCFLGFLPAKHAARLTVLRRWTAFEGALVLYEAPHRLRAMLADVSAVFEPERQVSLARELTKRFEEITTLPLAQVAHWLDGGSHREQGEYVVIVHAAQRIRASDSHPQDDQAWQAPERVAWMSALLANVSTRDAAKILSQALGLPKDECYRRLLAYSGK